MATGVLMWCVLIFVSILPVGFAMVEFANNRNNVRWKRSFEISKFELPRGGRKCHDLCSYMSHMCRNGGTCVIDPRTCEGRCECAAGWAGQWCKDRASDEELPDGATKLMSDEIGQTMFEENFPEKLYNRSERVVEEVTKEQTFGQTFITKLPSNIFPTNPPPVMLPSKLLSSKKPIHASTTPSIRSTMNSTSTKLDTVSEGRTKCQMSCANGDCYNIYGEYKCKPRVDPSATDDASKVCGPGFKCEHGICDLEALRNNSYDCICESNYVGQFCTHRCPLECGEHGFCDLHVADGTYKCFCQWNYTGLNCTELVPLDEESFLAQEDVVFHWYVVGVSIATVVFVLASTLLGAYFMWRRRLMFMLKIVHYFQQYEDDDGKEFDAFISYKACPADEAFVLHQLYPRLESQLNFKLCLHFRDFLPGEAIANNIVKAIESSRRTIMILSPAYVKSEWCRMEYQKAQHEMLKLKHKIIPIVLEDLGELTNVDKNLKTILNSVTYIEWPEPNDTKRLDKFWKKLELSMPKRSSSGISGVSNNIQDKTSPTSPSPNSPSSTSLSILTDEFPLSGPVRSPSIRRTSNSPASVKKTRKKDFRHFMDKLVQSSKLFKRQDSSSSQAALVDEETLASRSSCDSVSESVFTESSDSACSTPVTAHTYLGEVDERQEEFFALGRNTSRDFGEENNVFFSETSRRVSANKERTLRVCEKDHCEGSNCTSCLKLQMRGLTQGQGAGSFVNRGFESGENCVDTSDCVYCKRSDYNRVRISALGDEKLKIQKLLVDEENCMYCSRPLNRTSPYRGSMKAHKDLTNMELQKRSRVNSLPRNYKRTAELARRAVTLDIDSLAEDVGDSIGQCCIDICEDV